MNYLKTTKDKGMNIKSTSDLIKIAKEEKERLGVTNFQISNDSNLNESTIKRFFNQDSNPKIDTILKIFNTLNINLFVKSNENE